MSIIPDEVAVVDNELAKEDEIKEGAEVLRSIDGGRKYESKEYWDKRYHEIDSEMTFLEIPFPTPG